MNINLHNYQAYFLDYHEGSLSLDLVKELMQFVEQHPELREEFESFEPITLIDSGLIKYDAKASLKKEQKGIDTSNFEEYAIGYVEETLSAEEKQELKTFIAKNPVYQKEFDLYLKTKISADTRIAFQDKSSLKKGNKRPVGFYYWSAAASVALIIGMYFIFNKNEKPDGNKLVNSGVKDSDRFANHAVKSVDTAPKFIPANPHNSPLNNAPVVVKIQRVKENKNGIVIPDKVNKDSSDVVVNKRINKEYVSPVKEQTSVPKAYHPEGDSVAFNGNTPDTTVGQPLIIINSPHRAVASAPKIKKDKFLISLATVTCKGLHNITGKNIELEKHFASDTNTVVAYQLDLGNKKFQFPVKD